MRYPTGSRVVICLMLLLVWNYHALDVAGSLVPLDNGLIAHWKMNDNTNSLVVVDTKGHNGTSIRNTDVLNTNGVINKAFTFNDSDYIYVPYSDVFDLQTLTLSVWAKIDGTTGYGCTDLMLISKMDDYQGYAITYRIFPDNIWKVAATSGNLWGSFGVGYTPVKGEWTLYTFTIDAAGNFKFFANGNLIDSATAGVFTDTSGPVVIGKHYRQNWFLNGAVDDVRIYKRAITTNEIAAIYNNGYGTEVENWDLPPIPASNPIPTNTPISVFLDQKLSWHGPEYSAYDLLYFGLSNNMVAMGQLFDPSETMAFEVFAVAGGGSSPMYGGGGGAGGVIHTNIFLPVGSYPVIVGAGGLGGGTANASNGTDTVFENVAAYGGNVVAYGGGAGGGIYSIKKNGRHGGSGGGAGDGQGVYYKGGSGTAGQGFGGGDETVTWDGGGGGGGAAERGHDTPSHPNGGDGGDGISNNISGVWKWYGGGGGGMSWVGGISSTGGLGGGGKGCVHLIWDSTAGVPNTGGGGGTWKDGGSGIVIVRYPSQDVATVTGGTLTNYTENGTNFTAHIFMSNGTFEVSGLYIGTPLGTLSQYTPSNLIYSTNYEWRVDSYNRFGATTGALWNFGTLRAPTGTSFLSWQTVFDDEYSMTGNVAVLGNGLIAHWKMNDNTNSLVVVDTKGHNGTSIRNTDVLNTNGVINKAFTFNGSDYISVPYTNVFDLQTLTLSVWAKIDGTTGAGCTDLMLVSKMRDYQGYAINYRIFPDSIWRVAGTSGNLWRSFGVGYTPVNGEWTLYTFTVDAAGNFKFFANGNLIDSATAGAFTDSSGPVLIGKHYSQNWFLNGALDDVRIYNRAITPNEISAIYNNGVGTEVENLD